MNQFDSHRSPKAAATGGFTLVEILVVIAIIGLISAVLVARIMRGAREDALVFRAKGFIRTVEATLERYKGDRNIGVYPPTTLEGFKGVGRQTNKTNVGIETLVVCLNSPGFSGTRVLEDFEEDYANLDGDRSSKPLTILGTTELLEVLDPWGNPYVYFNCIDYGKADVEDYLYDPDGVEDYEAIRVKPWKNPKTKSFYNLTTFQLFSAGPDRKFNTDDDVGNW